MIQLALSVMILWTGILHAEMKTDKEYGSQSMIAPLKKVLVKRPDHVFGNADPALWHYTAKPDLAKAQAEHDAFVNILLNQDVEVIYHDEYLPGLADAIFVHDPVIVTDYGSVILRMGKPLRQGEEEAIERKLLACGIPTLAKLTHPATAEGGDLLWLDEHTLAAGLGFRTNAEGIEQLKHALEPFNITVIAVELPYWQGKEACLHLQSLISLVDEKTALVYSPLLPVWFVNYLHTAGFTLIEVPESEFYTMGPNVLAIQPGVCLTIEGNPVTQKRLSDHGIVVYTYRGDEISHKAEGGATCLTRPIWRGFTP
jgi:N-dimethylarginine dimethylaminohydrolase